MQGSVVVDASSLAALLLPERYSDWVEERLAEALYLHAPSLIVYEAANVLWKKHVLLGAIDGETLRAAFRLLERLLGVVRIHGFQEFIVEAEDIAVRERITVYDASYLALAVKLGARLVTLDVKLKQRLSGRLREIVVAP